MEVIHYPDGLEERLGEGPPPLCESCPYREDGGPEGRIRVVEIVLSRPVKRSYRDTRRL
jgi:hypothetical protein